MKKALFCLSLFAAIGFFYCETEPLDDGIQPVVPIQNIDAFSVDFDNNTFSTNVVESFFLFGKISITAQKANLGVFLFSINGSEEKTYTNNELNVYFMSNSGETYTSLPNETNGDATLTITKIDYPRKKISGTFSFTGTRIISGTPTAETKVFSQGKFTNVPITGDFVP